MKMDQAVMDALDLVATERGVAVETILDALANALVSAYKRSPSAAEEARVVIDPDSGDIVVYAQELDEDGNVTDEWVDTPDAERRFAPERRSDDLAEQRDVLGAEGVAARPEDIEGLPVPIQDRFLGFVHHELCTQLDVRASLRWKPVDDLLTGGIVVFDNFEQSHHRPPFWVTSSKTVALSSNWRSAACTASSSVRRSGSAAVEGSISMRSARLSTVVIRARSKA